MDYVKSDDSINNSYHMLGSRVGNLSYDSVGYLSLCLDAR